MFDHIRKLFARPRRRRCAATCPGRFSFNVSGGRCEACAGDGTIKIEMHFLPDVYVPCEVCKGARYNRDTLDITFKGKNIAEVLDLSCEEALEFFANQPAIARHMQTLVDVGLGYVRLGQPAPTLSGGEAQRVKLASELAKRSTGHTIYILDEPTTGLHFEDIRKLLTVLSRLVDQGNTVLVIEHNLDVIKTADWIIDLGPEGGSGGGTVVVEGPPEVVAATPDSYTGQFLSRLLPPEIHALRRLRRPRSVNRPSGSLRRVACRWSIGGHGQIRAPAPVPGDPRGGHRPRQGPRRPPRLRLHGLDPLHVVLRVRRACSPWRRTRSAFPSCSAAGGRSWVAGLSACAAAALGISIAQLVTNSVLLPRLVVFGAAVLLVPWFVLCATLARHARTRAEDRERLVFVGRLDEGQLLRDELAGRPERPAQLAKVLTCAEARSTGSGPPLIAAAAEASATLVVLDREAQADEHIVAQAALLHERGARVRTVSLFYEQWLGKIPLWELERVSLMFDIGEVHRDSYSRLKRLIDIALAAVCLPVLLVAIPCVAVANLLGNRGPLFFRQQRVGKSGKLFTIWKFRTMRDAPGALTYWTSDDDPRITRVGRILRSHPC